MDAEREWRMRGTEGAEEGPWDAGESHNFLQLLQFDLVVDHLTDYLSFEDMKALSLVSKDSLRALRRSEGFSKKARFIIDKDNIPPGLLQHCYYAWKHITFDLSIRGALPDLVRMISWLREVPMECARSLKLYASDPDDVDFKFLQKILGNAGNIRELELDLGDVEMKARDVSAYLEGLQSIRTLECLIIKMEIFPVELLLTLRKMLQNLRKFHVKTKTFVSQRGKEVDWEFLKAMTKLEDFYIRRPLSRKWKHVPGSRGRGSYGSGAEIIRSLPSNIKSISIVGFKDHFWKFPQVSGNIGNQLKRFSNLKELNLLRCGGAVTNDGLQGIIKNCPNLTKLAFSHCYALTNNGVTGNVRELNFVMEPGGAEERAEDHIGIELEPGVPLSNLKRLTELKIRACPKITSDCILRIVQFEHLEVFDFDRVEHPRHFLFQIVKQNPKLRQISLESPNLWNNDVALLNEVRTINPAIQQIEIRRDFGWEDQDSDSDASDYGATSPPLSPHGPLDHAVRYNCRCMMGCGKCREWYLTSSEFMHCEGIRE